MTRLRLALVVLATLPAATTAQRGTGPVRPRRPPPATNRAQLQPSADGLTVYDATLKVTWLANANLAATNSFGVTGVNPDGSMSWNTAQNWVAAMNAANYLGHNDWTLPPTLQPDPGCTQKTSLATFAYNCTGSHMGELFYNALGGSKGASMSSLNNSSARLFRNFQPYLYWSGTVYPVVGKSSWSFSFDNGFEGTNLNANAMYAIPEFTEEHVTPPPPPPNVGIGVTPAVDAKSTLAPSANGQLVYDATLKITWLAAMNAADYLGHRDWRLPKTTQPDQGCSITTVKLRQSSGYNCRHGEMGELFYTQLGSQAGSSLQVTHGREAGLFRNFQQSLYWSEADTEQSSVGAWTFSFGNGFQGTNFFSNGLYVMPVFDGQGLPPG